MSLTSYRAAPPRGRFVGVEEALTDLSGPGGDLLSRVLRQSTIGAEAFDGRVRDGIGSYRLAEGHQAGEDQFGERGVANGEWGIHSLFATRYSRA